MFLWKAFFLNWSSLSSASDERLWEVSLFGIFSSKLTMGHCKNAACGFLKAKRLQRSCRISPLQYARLQG